MKLPALMYVSKPHMGSLEIYGNSQHNSKPPGNQARWENPHESVTYSMQGSGT
jgi:hypothetical protein